MVSCRKFRKLIDLYLDGEANDYQAQTLLSHMENCEQCRKRYEEVKSLNNAIMSVPALEVPDGFRNSVLAGIQREEIREQRSIGFSHVMGWSGAAVAAILIFAVAWYLYSPQTAVAVPDIHIVSPQEDAAIEQQYVDISVAFNSTEAKDVRVILDGRDVTDATEINEEFLIYASDALESGYHMATVQITDDKGVPLSQRSWAFYVFVIESS